MVKVAPSFLGISEYKALRKFLSQIERYGADRVHIDFGDGIFIPEKSDPDLLWKMSWFTQLPQELHLMVDNPIEHLDLIMQKITKNRRDIRIIIHVEAKDYYECLIDFIKSSGFACGLAIKPETPLNFSSEILKKLDLITVMTVVPGRSGQTMLYEQLEKVSALVDLRKENECCFEIEVDGGVNNETVLRAINAGADVLVSGGHIQKHPEHIKLFHSLKI